MSIIRRVFKFYLRISGFDCFFLLRFSMRVFNIFLKTYFLSLFQWTFMFFWNWLNDWFIKSFINSFRFLNHCTICISSFSRIITKVKFNFWNWFFSFVNRWHCFLLNVFGLTSNLSLSQSWFSIHCFNILRHIFFRNWVYLTACNTILALISFKTSTVCENFKKRNIRNGPLLLFKLIRESIRQKWLGLNDFTQFMTLWIHI